MYGVNREVGLAESKRRAGCGMAVAPIGFRKGIIMNGNEILLTDATTAACPEEEPASIRLWLVDDNPGFRNLLASLLDDGGGFKCEREFSSPTGVLKALAEEKRPDVILLDIEMGEHNGLDAIAPIKALAPETHVMMLTTFARPGAREWAFRAGASDFMLKSWTMAEIAGHIRQAMEFGAVAGLLTAYFSSGHHEEEAAETHETGLAKKAIKSTLAERWLSSLRGWLKFSPS